MGLEQESENVPSYSGELERMIATLMDEVYVLSLTGEDNERKMRLVALSTAPGCCWTVGRSDRRTEMGRLRDSVTLSPVKSIVKHTGCDPCIGG